MAKWRALCRLRDNNSCIVCNGSSLLHVHHLNNWIDFPDLRLSVDNGITICEGHHIDFHTKYGKSVVKAQFEEYLCLMLP